MRRSVLWFGVYPLTALLEQLTVPLKYASEKVWVSLTVLFNLVVFELFLTRSAKPNILKLLLLHYQPKFGQLETVETESGIRK